MTRTCDGCGETFETLSRLRLHDCPAAEPDDDSEGEFGDGDRERYERRARKRRRSKEKRARRAIDSTFRTALEATEGGDHEAVYRMLAQYERHLEDATGDKDRYWQLHDGLFEPIADVLESTTIEEGWSYLIEILEAYWPEIELELDTYDDPTFEQYYVDDAAYPHVSHVLAAATGRMVVRTRLDDGVESIPETSLDFLFLHHEFSGEAPWIESIPYGWGIGHPEHPFEENVRTVATGGYDVWVGAVVEHALHADQHAATRLLETIFESDPVDDPAMVLRAAGAIDRGRYPDEPRYWDWESVYPAFASFEWDPDVERRLRDLVIETDLHYYLPEEWDLADIEV